MQHSFHLFVGDDLAPVAETVCKHINTLSDHEGRKFSHVATCLFNNNIYSIRQIDNQEDAVTVSNDTEASAYFRAKHQNIVIADGSDDISPCLYLCVYCKLYEKMSFDIVWKIVNWVNGAGKQYIIDIFGISEDLAHLFCETENDRRSLIYEIDDLKKQTIDFCKRINSLKSNDLPRHLFVIQACNQRGFGLEMDKSTLIRVFSEYARLTTTNFEDLFPVSDIVPSDIMSFGISAHWFNPKFFQEYFFNKCYIKILEREKVGQHHILTPTTLEQQSREIIDNYSSLLDSEPSDISNKSKSVSDFDKVLQTISDNFLSVINSRDLTLPEKRAMLALFLGEDDELLDDSVLLKDLQTIDDCILSSLNLFVDTNNRMFREKGSGVLSAPMDDNRNVYIPLDNLRKKRTQIRQSLSFIRRSEERLKDIEKSVKLIEDSKKRLTEKGFSYGDVTYKLLHEVVENPLEDTYTPKKNHPQSVDLRSGFSKIRDQKGLGACTSFSMSSIFEYILNKIDGNNVSLSPRFLYYNVCKKNSDDTPIDKGSSFYENIVSLGEDGICEEFLCPFEEDFRLPPTEESRIDANSRLVTKAENVDITHEALTSALADGHPIGVSLKVFDSFGKNHKGFVFRPSEKELKSTDYGYHAMVLCGYSEKEKIYIVRNSWGVQFGDKGYCYIPFSYIEDKSLCRQACIVTGVSCGEIVEPINDELKLSIENKDIEYSVLRILIEEEKLLLNKYQNEYDELYRDYMTLFTELTNKGKRDALMEYALSPSVNTPKYTTKQETVTKKVITCTNRYASIPILVLAVLMGIILPNPFSLYVSVSLLVISIFLYNIIPSSKDVEEVRDIKEPVVVSIAPSLELKYLFAGRIIDTFHNLRNDISIQHKLLQSYIGNLEIWLNETKTKLSGMTEDIRKPFYSLFSNDIANLFIDNQTDNYISNIWLYERFKDYDLQDDSIKKFKNKLENDIDYNIKDIALDFSMSQYLLHKQDYPYLPQADSQVLLDIIHNMSLPFAQINGGQGRRPVQKILLCKVDDEDKDIWNVLITNSYTDSPYISNETSSQKITYIQVSKLDLDEIYSI